MDRRHWSISAVWRKRSASSDDGKSSRTALRRRWRKTAAAGGRPSSRDDGPSSLEHFRYLEKTLCLQRRRSIFPGRRSAVAGEKPSSPETDRYRWRQTVVPRRWTVAAGGFPPSGENALPPATAESLPGTALRHRWRKTVVAGGRPSSRDDGPSSLEDFRRLEKTLCLQRRRRIFPGRRSAVAGEKPSPPEADRHPETMERRRWRISVVPGQRTVATRAPTGSAGRCSPSCR